MVMNQLCLVKLNYLQLRKMMALLYLQVLERVYIAEDLALVMLSQEEVGAIIMEIDSLGTDCLDTSLRLLDISSESYSIEHVILIGVGVTHWIVIDTSLHSRVLLRRIILCRHRVHSINQLCLQKKN